MPLFIVFDNVMVQLKLLHWRNFVETSSFVGIDFFEQFFIFFTFCIWYRSYMLVLKMFLNLLNTWMIFKLLFLLVQQSFCIQYHHNVRYLVAFYETDFNCIDVKNFNQLNFICYIFLTVEYHDDILVTKITFICKKRFYKIRKIFVSHNSIYSNAIKVFFLLFLLKKSHLFRCWTPSFRQKGVL